MNELEVPGCYDCPFYRSEQKHHGTEERHMWCNHPTAGHDALELNVLPGWCPLRVASTLVKLKTEA